MFGRSGGGAGEKEKWKVAWILLAVTFFFVFRWPGLTWSFWGVLYGKEDGAN